MAEVNEANAVLFDQSAYPLIDPISGFLAHFVGRPNALAG